MSDVQASTVASIISLTIAIVAVCKSFPRGDLLLPSLFLGAVYVLAVLYFYLGALYIEEQLSPHFHNTANFWVLSEFLIRCCIVTLLVVSVSIAGGQPQAANQPYSKIALGLLVSAQLLYLLWDGMVYSVGKSNETIKKTVKTRFLPSDIAGLVAALLMFGMALAKPETLTSGHPPNDSTVLRLPQASLFFGGFGTFLYILAVSGLIVTDGSIRFDGGIWRFCYEAVSRIKKREIR